MSAVARRFAEPESRRFGLHVVSRFTSDGTWEGGGRHEAGERDHVHSDPAERLAENDGLKGVMASIDALANNATIASAIRKAGADYPRAVKANQPTLLAFVTLADIQFGITRPAR